jgi:hypothetical protein
MRGKPGQIKVTGDEISGDGANFESRHLEIRSGIITRLTYPPQRSEANLGSFMGLVVRSPVPSTWDFSLTSSPAIVTDGSTYTIDVSDIVPLGAFAILMKVEMEDDDIGNVFQMTDSIRGSYIAGFHMYTVVSNQAITDEQVVLIDPDKRRLKYHATNTTWSKLNVLIKGWYIQ